MAFAKLPCHLHINDQSGAALDVTLVVSMYDTLEGHLDQEQLMAFSDKSERTNQLARFGIPSWLCPKQPHRFPRQVNGLVLGTPSRLPI